MRVIAGSLRGRRLKAPAWDGLRPTSDKLRETLFNVLGTAVRGARVLDGYAGTGAIGIEALSRGAAHATFIDDDWRAVALIAENLAQCGLTDGYVIIRASLARGLERLRTDPAFVPFDIILLDPPYEHSAEAELATAGEMMTPDGIVVLEHPRRRPAVQSIGPLARQRDLVSGDSALAFYTIV